MVTEWLVGVFSAVLTALLDWLPDWDMPAWMTSTDGAMATVFTYAASMGAWFPMGLATTVAVAVLATYAVAFVVKVVRIVASFLTLGGGSAA